jgi:SAM-dependent methyltransferase
VAHLWGDSSVEVQDAQNERPAVSAARRRTKDLLVGFTPAIDIGCGTGTGAVDLGRATVGVDSSPTMTGTARARGVTVVRGDAAALPLRSGSAAGARCDRVLYHLAQPAHALSEASRVLRDGGRIVCAHPDHESMVLEVPGAPEGLVALAKSTRIELNYLSGRIPRQVPRLLLDLGFSDVETEAFTEVVSDPDAPDYAVPAWLREWRDRGKVDISDAELHQWDAAVDDARHHGGFLFALTYLVTRGTR